MNIFFGSMCDTEPFQFDIRKLYMDRYDIHRLMLLEFHVSFSDTKGHKKKKESKQPI